MNGRSASMSKANLNRRSLLRRLGTAAFLATPVFRGVLNEARSATPLRFIVVQVPGGAHFSKMGSYENPFAVGVSDSNFNFGKLLSSLAPLQSDLMLIDKLGNLALARDEGHCMQSLLTGDSRGRGVEGKEFIPPGLTSVDQIIAGAIGSQTRFASLQLGVLTDSNVGETSLTSRRCIFSNGVYVQPITDPKTMFSRLFGNAAPTGATPTTVTGAPAPGTMNLFARKKSILDVFKAELTEIKGIAGSQEQQKLDEHLTSIRELEKSLPDAPIGTGASTGSTSMPLPPSMKGVSCSPPNLGAPTDVRTIGAAMNELLFQAINCDLTRVASLQWLNSEDSGTSWAFLGTKRGHHEMQHAPAADFEVVQTWLWSQVADLLKRFKATSEGAGSMLDNCAILVMSEQSNGNYHMGSPAIGFVAGKAGGAIRSGRTLAGPGNGAALNNLYVSLANVMGAKVSTVGEAKFCTAPLNLS